uniref:DDE Tnp4 domain-containing protein n=1 Tax=Acanthochromis polyacanthus TaxID=80966 RepID=A0A3Q1GZ70_9TELE
SNIFSKRNIKCGRSCVVHIHASTRAPRTLWMKVRSQDWWERIVMMEFTDSDWRDNFRMSLQSFTKLCQMMERVMEPCEITVHAPVPLGMRVAIVLYKLANCAEYRVIGNQFGVHKSIMKKMVYLFCHGIVDSVIRKLIRVCNLDHEFVFIKTLFLFIGCVDESRIPCLPPSDGYRDFINRKGWPSYVLQAVCDDKYCFWNVSCKMPGSAHDANALKQSDLFRNAHLLPKVGYIEGQHVDFFLLGDPAFPLMPWLMKGYLQSPRLTPQKESFNVYLSSARTSIEIAFGRLKSRFRVLFKRSDFHFTFTTCMVATCCALHNFCEMEKEHANPRWAEEAASVGRQFPQGVFFVRSSTVYLLPVSV